MVIRQLVLDECSPHDALLCVFCDWIFFESYKFSQLCLADVQWFLAVTKTLSDLGY